MPEAVAATFLAVAATFLAVAPFSSRCRHMSAFKRSARRLPGGRVTLPPPRAFSGDGMDCPDASGRRHVDC
jgi:hypothetical protein